MIFSKICAYIANETHFAVFPQIPNTFMQNEAKNSA